MKICICRASVTDRLRLPCAGARYRELPVPQAKHTTYAVDVTLIYTWINDSPSHLGLAACTSTNRYSYHTCVSCRGATESKNLWTKHPCISISIPYPLQWRSQALKSGWTQRFWGQKSPTGSRGGSPVGIWGRHIYTNNLLLHVNCFSTQVCWRVRIPWPNTAGAGWARAHLCAHLWLLYWFILFPFPHFLLPLLCQNSSMPLPNVEK